MNTEINERTLGNIRTDIGAYVAAGGKISTTFEHIRIPLAACAETLESQDEELEQFSADEWSRQFLANYLNTTSQTKLKRSSTHLRQHNLARKRANSVDLLGIDLAAENAHPHGSRAIRRKVSHDVRKGTKPGLFGRGSVRLTDADLVERHGRSALHVLSEDRFRNALDELNATGRRLDLRAKTAFQKTVEALANVMARRVSA